MKNILNHIPHFKKKTVYELNCQKSNVLILGTAGSGRAYHPWDDLKPCTCGCKERPLLMYEKNKLWHSGASSTNNLFVICSICKKHTKKADMATTIDDWNNDKVF